LSTTNGKIIAVATIARGVIGAIAGSAQLAGLGAAPGYYIGTGVGLVVGATIVAVKRSIE